MADVVPPMVPPCMVFCDGVIVERGTGKTTLVGMFSGIAAPSYPSPPMDFHVFVQLTSAVGNLPVRLSCVRTDQPDAEEIYSTTHVIRCRDKLKLEELHVIWKQFQFPAHGEYSFQLWSAGVCIAERRLTARIKGE